MSAVIATVNLRGEVEAEAQSVISALPGSGSPLLVIGLISSDRYDKPSSPRAMPAAAAVVTAIGRLAGRRRLEVALEARSGTWMCEPEDAVRVAMRVNRGNVGVAVSLSALANDDDPTLHQRLRLLMPKLLAVRRAPGDERVWQALAGQGYAGLVI